MLNYIGLGCSQYAQWQHQRFLRVFSFCYASCCSVHMRLVVQILTCSPCSLLLTFNAPVASPKLDKPRTYVCIACRPRCFSAKLISGSPNIVIFRFVLMLNRLKKCVTIENVAARDPTSAQLNVSHSFLLRAESFAAVQLFVCYRKFVMV
jgi:hypothetical protein